MASRKPRKPTRTPKPALEKAQTPTEVEVPKAKSSIMREVALADVRFGFGHAGFYVTQHYNPDDLIGRKGIKVYMNMRRDEQIKAALTTKKNAIIASGIEVAIEDKEREDDKVLEEQKRFIEFNLAEMEGTVETFMLDVLSAFDFGYSLAEPCYKQIDYGEWNGKIGWKALKVRRPEQIEFETDQFGNLTEYGIIQGNQPLPAERLAVFTYRKEFGNFYGTSDLRECYRAFFVKDTLIKFMAMCMERYGMPIPVAKTQQTLDDDVKAQLLQIMQNIQARTGIIIPSTIDLTFESPAPGAQAAYGPIFKQLDQWIAMAINVPSLIGAGGGKEDVGSNARAQTEMDTFLLTIEQARRELIEFFNDRIVKRLIDLNWNVEDGIYPRVRFRELTHERKIEILEQMQRLLTGGVITKTTDDEQYARDLVGLPELPEDEIAVGTREAKERDLKDQLDMAGNMSTVAPAVRPAPSTKDNGTERNPFQSKQQPEKFAQRDDLPRVPGGHRFAGRNDAPRDFDKAVLDDMIRRGRSLGYDEESLNFSAGFMSAPASKYQSLNEMADRGKALKMDARTIEFAVGFLGESLDFEKRNKTKENDYHLQDQHDQADHGNRGGGLVDTAVKGGGFTYNPIRMKGRTPPKNGFALSLRKDTEKVIDLNAKREAIKAEMVQYVRSHWETIKAQGNYLGGWIDRGKLYIDISNVVANKDEAIKKARKADQLAIFDLGKGETIEIKKVA